MWLGAVSIFPEMFRAITETGITGRAFKNGLATFRSWNPRDFTQDRHRTVDDRPYGGGPGMIMKPGPLRDSIRAARAAAPGEARVLYMSPQGRRVDQRAIRELAQQPNLIFVCGRYEGIDERIIETEIDEEWSLGDFVLSGGELAAMAMMDALVRLIPGALGHELSAEQDSFEAGLLDCPHYTRPEDFEGRLVPSVLLQGHHEQVRRWRLKQSLGRTWLRRPDLLAELELSQEQEALLAEFMREHEASKPMVPNEGL